MGVTQRLGTIPLAIQTDSSNNIGIGGSPSGSYKFEVTGTARVSGLLTGANATFGSTGTGNNIIALSNNDQSNTRLRITNTGSGGQTFSIVGGNPGASNAGLAIFDETNSATRLYISSAGNVGIGTSSPWGIFNVVAGTNKSLIIQDSGIADTIEIASYSTSGGTRAIAMNGSVLAFGTGTAGGGSATPRLTINATGNVGIGTSSPAGILEIGKAGVANTGVYGGHLFDEIRIPQGTWTTFATVTDQSWAGITELTWTSVADYNRSGAAYMRWAYTGGNIGVVYTLYNNSQNATASFRYSGGYLQINISGGAADYYVQVRIQGSRAA